MSLFHGHSCINSIAVNCERHVQKLHVPKMIPKKSPLFTSETEKEPQLGVQRAICGSGHWSHRLPTPGLDLFRVRVVTKPNPNSQLKLNLGADTS